MKLVCLFLLILSFHTQADEQCRPDNGKPIITKFDFNFMGCFNFYAVDLGIDAANKKCKILSTKHDFSDKNFSKCIDIYQPSRAEWKADITDKCLELSEKNDFLASSFEACVKAFSISTAGSFSKEKKQCSTFCA